MTVSLLIATRNRCASLRQTLQALNAVYLPEGMNREVLVIDNGSCDGTSEFLAAAGSFIDSLRLLREEQQGKARALNRGLAAAKGDILVFLDDDVQPDAAWLKRITHRIVNGQSDAVCGSVKIAPHLLRPWMTATHRAWLASTEYLDAKAPETAVGANMAVGRHVFNKIPLFDTMLGPGSLGLWEDTLFSLQIKKACFRMNMAMDAIVTHHFDSSRLTREAFITHARQEGRSSAYVAWHWRHDVFHRIRWQILQCQMRLLLKRMLYRNKWAYEEGIPEWEMNLICTLEFYRSYLAERRRPHAYEQYGFIKLRN